MNIVHFISEFNVALLEKTATLRVDDLSTDSFKLCIVRRVSVFIILTVYSSIRQIQQWIPIFQSGNYELPVSEVSIKGGTEVD